MRGTLTLNLKPELKALLESKQEKQGCEKGNTRTCFPISEFHYPRNPEIVNFKNTRHCLCSLKSFIMENVDDVSVNLKAM